MTTEGEPVDRHGAPPRVERASTASAPGVVLCLFDGTPATLAGLRTAAAAARAAGRRLVVAHRETTSSGFWAAAFTGYGACLGPPERFAQSTAAHAFSVAVEELLPTAVGWDFATFRCGSVRGLRELVTTHEAAVAVIADRRGLAKRLRRGNTDLTVLACPRGAE